MVLVIADMISCRSTLICDGETDTVTSPCIDSSSSAAAVASGDLVVVCLEVVCKSVVVVIGLFWGGGVSVFSVSGVIDCGDEIWEIDGW